MAVAKQHFPLGVKALGKRVQQSWYARKDRGTIKRIEKKVAKLPAAQRAYADRLHLETKNIAELKEIVSRKGKLVAHESLPGEIRREILGLLNRRGTRALLSTAGAEFGGTAGLLMQISRGTSGHETTNHFVIPIGVGALVGFGGTLYVTNRAVKNQFKKIGELVRNSRDPELLELKKKYNLFFIDGKGNLRAVNSSAFLGFLGRRREKLS